MDRYFKDKNFLAGVFFLVFDFVYLGVGMGIPVSDSSSVGAGFMPRVYGGIMLAVSLILLITSAVKIRRKTLADKEKQTIGRIEKKDASRVAAAFASILLYVILLKHVGFLICSVPLMYVLVYLLTPQHVADSFVKKYCCGEDGKLKEECRGNKGKVKFSAMAPYYGKILAFSVIYTIFIYVLFAEGLSLKMPAGILKNVFPF